MRSLNQQYLEVGDTIPQGLYYHPEYLDAAEQQKMSQEIADYGQWATQQDEAALMSSDLPEEPPRGWVQTSEYEMLQLHEYMFNDPEAPPFIHEYNRRLKSQQYQYTRAKDVQVNRYPPQRGIHMHNDRFDYNNLAMISLGETCLFRMDIEHTRHQAHLVLNPGDLYILSGPASSQWRHGILSGSSFTHRGTTYNVSADTSRISVAFRTIITPELLKELRIPDKQAEFQMLAM